MSAEFIVVGSGPSAVHAALTLLEGGARVRMLDVGVTSGGRTGFGGDAGFLELRRTDPDQHRVFLGDEFEGIPLGRLKAGSGLSTPRQFVTARVDALTPIRVAAGAFQPVESLAAGGLGGAWGLGCFTFSRPELERMGLDAAGIERSYQTVADRIGISAEPDDGTPYFKRAIERLQPGLELDESSELLLKAYRRNRARLNRKGIHVGRTALALLSEDKDGRRANAYRDLDFWSDSGHSAWRPALALEQLKRHPRFEYRPESLVLRFSGTEGGPIEVEYLDLSSGERRREQCRKLVLAAGALGTARIVLRSRAPRARLPLLCNPYFYALCLRPGLIGRTLRDRRHSMGQLVLVHDERRDGSHVPVASLLSYRSLLLFRLIKEAPLSLREGRGIFQILQSALTIAGIFHPDGPLDDRSRSLRGLSLAPDATSPTSDRLEIEFRLSDSENARVSRNQRAILSALSALGAYPIRTIDPGLGASIHYGGTLPYGAELGAEESGRLRGASSVWLADGSPFRFVPAKGVTLTLMAHADWVARQALRS